MLIITRSVVAAAVIVGTVVISLGASFGLSVLIWQHIIGIELHWMVLAMSVIILLAVGADYNLLLVSRLKEEMHAGVNTGIIRAMGGSGSVVTSAGLVFAFTMMSMAVSELTVIGQVGTTIGLGLLFDTLVIRSFMTPSIAALMGKWFWWPQRVRARPVPSPWPQPPQQLAPRRGRGRTAVKRLLGVGIALAAAALLSAAPAQADVDTDFANELHIYGIYGQKDYNAWIAKITCKRLNNGLDTDATHVGQVHPRSAAEGQHHRAGLAVPRCRFALLLPRQVADSRQAAHSKENEMLRKASIAAAALSCAAMIFPGVASADATDEYPIPNRIMRTTCTVDQYMAATRDRTRSTTSGT